jgi:hypothetical protein
MTAVQWPEIRSIGPTVLAMATLAFVLSKATVRGAGPTVKVSNEVWTKAKRLVEELQAVQAAQAECLAVGGPRSPVSAADVTHEAEAMAQAYDRFLSALKRSEQAAQMFARALDDASALQAILERQHPGWSNAVAKARPLLDDLRKEIAAFDLENALVLRAQMDEFFSRSLAEQGFDEWASVLLADDDAEGLFNEADAKPIHWDDERGWVEGPR